MTSQSHGRRRVGHSLRCGGLTLIEVVVALTLASLLTLVLASLLRGTRASEAALDRTLDPVQTLDLASELLREEVSLAGAVPWPPATAIDDLPDGLDVEGFVSRALEIGSSPGGHRITVRYVDDRLADGPRARVVTFEAGVDARSEPQLYRRPGTAARQPLVEGTDRLSVEHVVQAGETRELSNVLADEPAWALVVRLGYGEASRELVIELPSRPPVTVIP